jgi:HlyD family secretion protein
VFNPWKPFERNLSFEPFAMKNGKLLVLLVGVMLVLAGTVYTVKHLRDQEQQAEATYGTETPRVADIVLKTLASGSVQPRQEILIKPQVSGIVRRVLVEAGDAVEAGDVLAEVMIVPDVAALSNAESRLARAQITLDDAQLNHDRNADLLERGVVAPAEAQRTEIALKQAREELYAAEDNLRIVQEGVTARGGDNASNTMVKATVSGMVLEVPVKKGNSVIEANNFNEGTTIASVADMADLQFVGKIDESEVEKLHEGMPIRLTIGAIEGSQIPATLEHIAPKGVAEGGAIQFEIKAAVILEDGQFLRAGYSATADVVLDERTQVLAVSERLIQYDQDQPFVDVLVGENAYERRDLKVGVSDGLVTEVLSGLTESDAVKIWNQPRYE